MSVSILQGDVRAVLAALPAGHFHCVVTSPPYWRLRSYLPADHELKPLELGAEPTPECFVANLVDVFRGVRRVLRDDGMCFVNIGDTRNDGNRSGIPERLALALAATGWIWRDTIVWHKPAPMPESITGTRWQRHRTKVEGTGYKPGEHPSNVYGDRTKTRSHAYGSHGGTVLRDGAAEWTDCPGCPKCAPAGGFVLRRGSWRCTASHEYILMLTKTSSYFADQDAVRREPVSGYGEPWPGGDSAKKLKGTEKASVELAKGHTRNRYNRAATPKYLGHPAGANPRSVWTIPSEPFKEEHFAAFPSELPHRCIAVATSATGCCPTCGACIGRMVDVHALRRERPNELTKRTGESGTGNHCPNTVAGIESITIGWRPTCECPPAPPVPCRVLDPFGGSGTTGVEALRMGCDATLIELHPEYVALAHKRISAEFPLFHESSAAGESGSGSRGPGSGVRGPGLGVPSPEPKPRAPSPEPRVPSPESRVPRRRMKESCLWPAAKMWFESLGFAVYGEVPFGRGRIDLVAYDRARDRLAVAELKSSLTTRVIEQALLGQKSADYTWIVTPLTRGGRATRRELAQRGIGLLAVGPRGAAVLHSAIRATAIAVRSRNLLLAALTSDRGRATGGATTRGGTGLAAAVGRRVREYLASHLAATRAGVFAAVRHHYADPNSLTAAMRKQGIDLR